MHGLRSGVWQMWRCCGSCLLQETGRGRVLCTATEPALESGSREEKEPWQSEEVQRWEFGRRRLAAMMGADEKTFSEKDVSDALNYLLPSRLTAADARPMLRHPSKVFDKRKESAFDVSGRPLETAFYTGCPAYHNFIYQIHQLQQQLDTDEPPEAGEGGEERETEPLKFWVKRKTLANLLAEELSEEQYQDLVSRLGQLAAHARAATISQFLDRFHRPHLAQSTSSQPPLINSHGQFHSIGRRKSSVAGVYLSPGVDGVTVNSEPLLSYFPLAEQRQQVLYPLVLTDMLGGVAVTATVRGGGKTGQAGAIRLAISKALMGLPGQHHGMLEGAGLLVRDPRAVERKKPGQKKARKKFAWVKR